MQTEIGSAQSLSLEEKLKHYRLNHQEYQLICDLLKRPPQSVEWALFSALWSEHCSYKSSKIHIRKFAETLTQEVLAAEGENAGVLDLGFGERVVFKMESHNHPSYIEPFQGAATGVGGILRDIFTMGARPIVAANFLCFGEETAFRMPQLIEGVVKGISYYGNCVGVPTLTGRTHFFSEYNQNILVNAFALGFLGPADTVASNQIQGSGNWVIYVGAKTGRDGIHGASMASESFTGKALKTTVQIGDAFYEKLLIEACLEVINQKLVVAIQDMGAAGLTSSSFEMASRGGVGLDLHLDQVPLRDETMTPEDILLSESQERMLLVIEPQKFSEIQKVFERYGLDAAKIGETRTERKMRLFWKKECLTEIDPHLLTENAPRYQRPFENWKFPNRQNQLPVLEKFDYQLKSCFSKTRSSSKKYIYEQYDKRVGARTLSASPRFFGAIRLPSGRALSVGLGCRPEWMKRDAFVGAADAVLEPSLAMASQGFTPKAVTDCLNFGNPENSKIMSEFVASVEAIKETCLRLQMPVLSGNVSFYNETKGQNIISTPAVGVVGTADQPSIRSEVFVSPGNRLFRVQTKLAASRLDLSSFSGDFSLDKARDFSQAILSLAKSRAFASVESVKLVGSQGLLKTVYKMLLQRRSEASEVGSFGESIQPFLKVQLSSSLSLEELVDDILYQFVYEVRASDRSLFESECQSLGLDCAEIGEISLAENFSGEKLCWKNHEWSVEESIRDYQQGGIFAKLK